MGPIPTLVWTKSECSCLESVPHPLKNLRRKQHTFESITLTRGCPDWFSVKNQRKLITTRSSLLLYENNRQCHGSASDCTLQRKYLEVSTGSEFAHAIVALHLQVHLLPLDEVLVLDVRGKLPPLLLLCPPQFAWPPTRQTTPWGGSRFSSRSECGRSCCPSLPL